MKFIMVEIRSIVMSKEAPKWQKATPERKDVKEILDKTKKFAEMYLTVLKDRKQHWEKFLESQKDKEENGS